MINIDKYRVAANITEYHIVSNLSFYESFMIIRQLFHVTTVCKIVKNQHVELDVVSEWGSESVWHLSNYRAARFDFKHVFTETDLTITSV